MSGGDGVDPLYVPDAPHGPGDEADFTEWPWSPGDLGRPEIDCDASETVDLAEGLVRVLGDDNKTSGDWDPKLSPEVLIQGLEHMMRLRIFDDRMMKMQRTGKLSSTCVHSGRKRLLSLKRWLSRNVTGCFPTYRQPGAQFVRNRDMVSMICHCIGNEMDNVKGRQMPVHYTYKEVRFISVSSPVGTQFSQAVGVALASNYKGLDEVTITWIGDGASAEETTTTH